MADSLPTCNGRGRWRWDLTQREFDTIDAIHTLDGGEHTLAALAVRMRVSVDCIEKRVDRMRKRGLMDARTIEASGDIRQHIVVCVTDAGERLFLETYEGMAVAS